MSDQDHDLASAGRPKFVSLTTFRRSGEPVSTPVWIARSGDALVVTTPRNSGKVRRLRADPRVELRPCSRTGKVDDRAPATHATAGIVADPAQVENLSASIRSKYPVEYRVVMAVERLLRRSPPKRVILRLTEPSGGASPPTATNP